MKGSGCVIAVPLAIASSVALLAAAYLDPPPNRVPDPKPEAPGQGARSDGGGRRKPDPTDRFAPRFDGLRFIETLITAHRFILICYRNVEHRKWKKRTTIVKKKNKDNAKENAPHRSF